MSLVQNDGCDDLKYRLLATLEVYGEFGERGHNTRLEKLGVMRRLAYLYLSSYINKKEKSSLQRAMKTQSGSRHCL